MMKIKNAKLKYIHELMYCNHHIKILLLLGMSHAAMSRKNFIIKITAMNCVFIFTLIKGSKEHNDENKNSIIKFKVYS